MKRSTRAVLAQETLQIVEAGGYQNPSGNWVDLRDSIEQCLDDTCLFMPEDLRSLKPARSGGDQAAEISVTAESTLEAAQRLSRQDGHLVLLNFASARNAGGGFLNGSQAQEESLARSSALYASQILCPEFYEHHRAHHDALYTHRMIVSPHCPVFREDEGSLLEGPYLATIITSPAPNAGAVRKNQGRQAPDITKVLRERARLVLKLAAHLGADSLVLGAWGCGVFQNDPGEVAAVFAELLESADAASWGFQRVVFAIYDSTPGQSVLSAFHSNLEALCSA